MNWSNTWGDTAPNLAPQPQINPEPSAFPEWDAKDRDAVLVEWGIRKQALDIAKEAEMAFRKYVVKRAFPNPDEGVNNLELGNGYTLKANVKYNYKLADNKIVEDGLDKLCKIGNNGSFIADRLVSWTPNFLLTEYRELQKQAADGSVEAKQMLQVVTSFLTIEEAAPSLEIREPKAKKK